MDPLFTIGSVCRLFGITPDTLRHYEKKGLLTPVTDPHSRYRYYTPDHLDRIEGILHARAMGIPLAQLNVDGGASRDGFLMQFQADILNKPVCRPVIRETTAIGAAFLAGLAVGFWKDLDELRAVRALDRQFVPAMEEERRRTLLAGWHKAVGRSLDWAEHT